MSDAPATGRSSPTADEPRVLGLGLALPAAAMDRDAALAVLEALCPPPAERPRAWRLLLRRSGVDVRHSAFVSGDPGLSLRPTSERMAMFDQAAPPLGEQAARDALDESGVAPGSITHLITVSCTGMSAPGLGVSLVDRLGLSPSVARTHVGFMGCHGALIGLRAARGECAADPDARALVVCVELCTLHARPSFDEREAVAQTLFADGAGALVVGATGNAPWRLGGHGTWLLPHGRDLLTWDVAEQGFACGLSPRLPDLIAEHLPVWLDGWLGARGLHRGDVAGWAVHPGGPRILRAVQDGLDLPEEALAVSRRVLARCGNMSSPTVLFVLDQLRDAGGPVVALGLGPGPAFEAALLHPT